jgi:hypothetical protein
MLELCDPAGMILATSRLSFEDLPMATELCVSSVRLGRPGAFFYEIE